MSLYPVAGCRLYIGGTKQISTSLLDASDFSGQSWTEIDGLRTLGSIGENSALITAQLINRDYDFKGKGTANAGQMQSTFVQMVEDAGQIALLAASLPSNRENYAFRLDLNDATGGGDPSKRYFIGLVMSFEEPFGEANTLRNLTSMIEVNSNIVRVAAT